jgi:hypothetical protein
VLTGRNGCSRPWRGRLPLVPRLGFAQQPSSDAVYSYSVTKGLGLTLPPGRKTARWGHPAQQNGFRNAGGGLDDAAISQVVGKISIHVRRAHQVHFEGRIARGITPWIPVFGQYKPEIEGFTYDKETDCFTCPAGKPLPFKRFDSDQDGRLSKRYSASSSDCRRCPHKPTCAPKSTKRKLTRTAYDAHYRRALARQQSRSGRRMRRLRQRTVESVFGSLLQHYGMRRVNTRGRSSAHKTMLLTAIAFNLKKLLKHQSTKLLRLAIALHRRPLQGLFLPFWRQLYRRQYPQYRRVRSSATATAP